MIWAGHVAEAATLALAFPCAATSNRSSGEFWNPPNQKPRGMYPCGLDPVRPERATPFSTRRVAWNSRTRGAAR
jgi:hypothetical protein